ncbi:sphingomyelin phosphodiesterase 3, neutral membrane (neutral sphingomyelinase II) [Perkinsus olseni]|uniref:Sphingomyelin phosphodiesterase 3, neutral membrane (Neutral sphingomyelinase II) n=1 Tax=Perkinsus olseni TaxID=32597 RepID=A0A7J6L9M1_PEROL|nr:sphingomyelin phosphodiesterase 3, neutral membrane (neutral sphingomyelinase II) [Perkinsus olseni]
MQNSEDSPEVCNLPASTKDTAEGDVINIMTFNTWLIPVRAGFPGCLDPRIPERAQRVCRHIEQQAQRYDLDVVTLQEAWTGRQSAVASMINTLFCGRFFARGQLIRYVQNRTQLKYATKAFGTHLCECSAPTKFLDSGLVIMSRWPILMEKFSRFTVATGEDALASKGALGVVLDRGKDVIIVVTTHLDAGHDPDVKLAQLKVVVDVVAYLERECSSRGLRVAAAAMTGDWNIDGTGRDSGASAKDVWQMHADKESLPRAPSYEGDWGDLSDESLAKYGVTSDQDVPSCPKRLDYLWVKSGVTNPAEEGVAAAGNRPPAESSLSSTSASSSSSAQEVMMVTIAPAQLWRADVPLRSACAKAVLSGDKKEERGLRRQINSHNTNRTSDHASLVGRVRLQSSEAPVSPENNRQAKEELERSSQMAGSAELADIDSSEILLYVSK